MENTMAKEDHRQILNRNWKNNNTNINRSVRNLLWLIKQHIRDTIISFKKIFSPDIQVSHLLWLKASLVWYITELVIFFLHCIDENQNSCATPQRLINCIFCGVSLTCRNDESRITEKRNFIKRELIMQFFYLQLQCMNVEFQNSYSKCKYNLTKKFPQNCFLELIVVVLQIFLINDYWTISQHHHHRQTRYQNLIFGFPE